MYDGEWTFADLRVPSYRSCVRGILVLTRVARSNAALIFSYHLQDETPDVAYPDVNTYRYSCMAVHSGVHLHSKSLLRFPLKKNPANDTGDTVLFYYFLRRCL